MSALEQDWFVGALIREAPSKDFPEGKPTWRYRVGPFQEAVAVSGMSSSDLEELCGWSLRHGGYLSRVLGLRPKQTTVRRGRRYGGGMATSMSYDHAVRIARALDLDFVQWEL